VQQCDVLMVRAGMRGALSDYTGVAVIRPRLCMLDGGRMVASDCEAGAKVTVTVSSRKLASSVCR
jgi:hypothetical protein